MNASAPPPVLQPAPQRPSFRDRFPGTFGLVLVTCLVFLGQWLSQQFLGVDWLLQLGAKASAPKSQGQWWRFLTPVFLHIGLPHLFINMYSLFAIGPAVERFFGTTRFLATYILSGLAGVIASLAFSPYASAGASGAIFGLLGSLGSFLYLHRALFGRLGQIQLRQILFVALLNLALGLMPGIDNWGHLGGLLSGACLSYLLGPRYQVHWNELGSPRLSDARPWHKSRLQYLLAAAVLGVLAMASLFSPFA